MSSERNLFIRETRPSSSPKGAFLFLHGVESHSGWLSGCADRLAAGGYAAVLYDRAGWGESPGPRGHLAGYGDFLETLSLLAVRAREQYGAVHLAGMSWGGMAALYAALRRPWLFDSVSMIAPGIAAKRDIPLRDKLRAGAAFFRNNPEAAVPLRFRPEDFTRDAERRAFIRNDPARVRAVTASFCVETLKMRRFIGETAGRRLLPPALCLLAGDDGIIDNRKVSALCVKAGALVETIPGCAHTLVFERPEQTAAALLRHAGRAAAAAADAAAAAAAGKTPGTVWIVGAGAVGGAMAALLSFGGVRTGVLVKERHRESLAKQGLVLQTGSAVRTARDTGNLSGVTFADRPEGLPPDPDLVILAVKSFDTGSALVALGGKIPQGTVLASLQNGVDNEDRIARRFPGHTIAAASICASLELDSPGRVLLANDTGGLGAAVFRGDADTARSVWMRIMPRTGMECRWYGGGNDGVACKRLKYSKLMLNIGFNALNSVTGLTGAEILRHGEYGPLALAALREGFRAMDGLGLYPLNLPGFPVSTMRMLTKIPGSLPLKIMAWRAGRAPEAAFSMRQDIVRRRQHTEIQELNGKIVAISRALGLTPHANEKLVELVENFTEKTLRINKNE